MTIAETVVFSVPTGCAWERHTGFPAPGLTQIAIYILFISTHEMTTYPSMVSKFNNLKRL
jgi:hypothetical protein